MTLDRFRSVADRLLDPFVRGADAVGLTPNAVTVLAAAVAAVAGGALALSTQDPVWFLVAAVLVGINGWLDLLDGALAREQDVASEGGDLLDHVVDRYADIFIIVGVAAGAGRYALGLAAVTGVLMTSYLGTQSEAVGLDRVYGGLLGRADRLALTGAVGVVAFFVSGPVALDLSLLGWLLVVFAVVGHLTALQRFYFALRALD